MSNFLEKAQKRTINANTTETREIAEVKAQIFLARQFPRDINLVLNNITEECKNLRLAESAQYRYLKGKKDQATEVKGASIRLLEVIARNWGNCDSSLIELERRPEGSTVKARFWDFETNAQQSKTFEVDFVRNTKNGSYQITDEREKYELMANYGARRLRSCMQAGIPAYVIDIALAECEKTLEKSVRNGKPIEETRQNMLEAFQHLAAWITPGMLGNVVHKDFDGITVHDIVKLKSLYNAIKDGFVRAEEAFEQTGSGGDMPTKEEQQAAKELNEELGL